MLNTVLPIYSSQFMQIDASLSRSFSIIENYHAEVICFCSLLVSTAAQALLVGLQFRLALVVVYVAR